MQKSHRFRCSVCKDWHDGLPELGFDAPLPYHELSEEEREQANKSDDLCSIADRDFFVRAVIPLRVIDGEPDQMWCIGAWVSLKKENYERYIELFNRKEVDGNGPYTGWLCNRIDGYPDTYCLRTRVHLQLAPMRPVIELEPTDHPLAVQQREGIRMREVQALVERVLHSIN
jgi:hypothetical protein